MGGVCTVAIRTLLSGRFELRTSTGVPRARRGTRPIARDRHHEGTMPELPEVEITARRLSAAVRGVEIESTLAPGINALKTFDPPLHALDGAAIEGVRR